MIRYCQSRPDIWLDGETLKVPGGIITGTDLIDLYLLGQEVPVFENGAITGSARRAGNLIHLSTQTGFYVLAYKCLLALMSGQAGTIRAQSLPRKEGPK